MTSEELAYVAGIIDGEGCICLSKSRPNKASRCVSPSYNLRCSVGMADKALINWLKESFGGCCYLAHVSQTMYGTEDIWVWHINSNKVSNLLKLLLPYLRVKREQALKAIDFQEYKSQVNIGVRRSQKVQDFYESAYLSLRKRKK